MKNFLLAVDSILILIFFVIISAQQTQTGANGFIAFIFYLILIKIFAAIIRRVLSKFLAGKNLKSIFSGIYLLEAGASIYAFIITAPLPDNIQKAGYLLFGASFFIALYEISEGIFKQKIVLCAFVRFGLLLLTGFTTTEFLNAIFPSGRIEIGDFAISVLDIILLGFIISSLCVLLSMLELSSGYYASRFARWMGSSLWVKFTAVCAILFYIIDLRPYLEFKSISPASFEWIILCIVCVAFFLKISKQMKKMKRPVDYGKWTRHHQKLVVYPNEEISALSQHIENFVERSDKTDLTIYLISESEKSGLSPNDIRSFLRDFLNYGEPSAPSLISERKKKILDKKFEEQRYAVVCETIRKYNEIMEEFNGQKNLVQ